MASTRSLEVKGDAARDGDSGAVKVLDGEARMRRGELQRLRQMIPAAVDEDRGVPLSGGRGDRGLQGWEWPRLRAVGELTRGARSDVEDDGRGGRRREARRRINVANLRRAHVTELQLERLEEREERAALRKQMLAVLVSETPDGAVHLARHVCRRTRVWHRGGCDGGE